MVKLPKSKKEGRKFWSFFMILFFDLRLRSFHVSTPRIPLKKNQKRPWAVKFELSLIKKPIIL